MFDLNRIKVIFIKWFIDSFILINSLDELFINFILLLIYKFQCLSNAMNLLLKLFWIYCDTYVLKVVIIQKYL